MTRRFGIGLLIALLALLAPRTASAQAQAVNGNIEGTVRDTSGAALPGVMVTVTNVDTGTVRTAMTSENALFQSGSSTS